MSEGKDYFPTNPNDDGSKEVETDVMEQEEPVRIGQIASMLDQLSEPKKKKVTKKTKQKKTESIFEIVSNKNPETETVSLNQMSDSKPETEAKSEKKVEPDMKAKPEVEAEPETEGKAPTEAKVEKRPKSVAKPEKKEKVSGAKKAAEEENTESTKKKTETADSKKESAGSKDESADSKKATKKKPGKKTAELIRMTALKGAKAAELEEVEEAETEDAEEAEELAEQRAEEEEVETQLERTRNWIREKVQNNRLLVLVTGIILLILAVYYLVHSQTYENISVINTEVIQGAVNCNYVQFEDGFIKYSQDGVAFLSKEGNEKWNLAYQIADPFVEINGKTGAVADKEGQSIVVFQKSGVIGQMETTLPIEKISVSKQGIVCAILQNEDSAMVMCYDLVGKVLVEHKTAFGGTGYPMDVALSENGENLMVTYLYAAEGIITTKVMFYNFGEAGHNISDHQIAQFEYPGTISATCFYLDKNVCVMVGDDKLVYYNGSDEPEEQKIIELDKEIKNLCYDNANIGLVLKNGKESGYEARMYDLDGNVKMSTDFTGEYNHVKISNDQLLMYDGKRCGIVLKNGVQKFKGELENIVLEIVPEGGVNKYLLVDQDGFKKIRLVK
ncbi:MAG: DUF5711 family protein [Dorea sp.]|nr:DUF5711 family protein [Dorea sp.]